jgi:murein DD-endopeptidase MepM/ murein hydrolase activator NlpD
MRRGSGRTLLALLGVIGAAMLAAPAAASAGSAHIAALQVAMSAFGLYPHPVDGVSGAWTEQAVRTFQSQHGLTVDGVAGPQTRVVLGWRGKPNLGDRPLTSGKKGWDVAALQFLLNSRSFGPGGFDGGFGPNTDAALRRYQQAAGLTVDGVAGPSTIASLRGNQVISAAPPSDPVRFVRPLPGPIGDGFGWIPPGRWHTGLDFPAAKGTPIGAGGRGTVVFAGFNTGGYGNLVVVRHRLGYESWYAHMSVIAATVGQYVVGGTVLGYVGSTGHSTGPHLHFEVRRFGTPINPVPQLIGYVATHASASSASGDALARAASAHGAKKKRRGCRPNADARNGRDTDPLTARLDRCP